MKNPLAILFILFGVGALLVLAELVLSIPIESVRAELIPIAIAVAVALGCLGSGIVLVIADIKYKLPPKNEENHYRDHYRDQY